MLIGAIVVLCILIISITFGIAINYGEYTEYKIEQQKLADKESESLREYTLKKQVLDILEKSNKERSGYDIKEALSYCCYEKRR